MAYLQTHYYSRALDVSTEIEVLLPEPYQGIGVNAGGGEAGLLYLLHGYSDDQTIWMRRTSIERYAAAHNMAVIMPGVNHSFYTNEPFGEKYWDFVSEELPAVCHQFFHLTQDPAKTFVAGLSMGGYGAMKLALRHPERFAAAGCFSGVLDVGKRLSQENGPAYYKRLFGSTEAFAGSENDLLHLLTLPSAHRPRLFVACGEDDSLYAQYASVTPLLQENGWDVTCRSVPGYRHEWGFWDLMIQEFLDFAAPVKR